MKKLSFALALAVALIASQAFAIPPAGSGKQSAAKAGSMNNVVNHAVNAGNTNLAIGEGSSAHTGSIVNEGGEMNNVVNQAVNAGNTNLAIGKNSSATTGSIVNK